MMCCKHHEIPDMGVHFLAYLDKCSENLRKFSHCKLHKDVHCSVPNTEVSLGLLSAKERYRSVPNFFFAS